MGQAITSMRADISKGAQHLNQPCVGGFVQVGYTAAHSGEVTWTILIQPGIAGM